MATHSKSGTTITAYNADMLDGYHADEFVKGEGGTLVDLVYPVGAIYMSINPASPSLLLGGTWATWGTGRVPVGVDTSQADFDTVEKTGGSTTVALTSEELAAHIHGFTPAGTLGTQSASHTHAVSITSGNVSAGHTHTINHDHASFTSGSAGAHTHTAAEGTYKVGSGSGSTYAYFTNDGTTGGANTSSDGAHTHSVDVPAYSGSSGGISANHTHSVSGNTDTISANHTHTFTGTAGTTGSTGSGTAHNNLQPYITCYMWVRTA